MTNMSKKEIENIKNMIKKEGIYTEKIWKEKPKKQKKVAKKKPKVREKAKKQKKPKVKKKTKQISLRGISHAKIIDASVRKVVDLWKKKPQGLSFADTDAIIVTAKTSDGNILKETFYTCIKPDGTFNMRSLSHASQVRRKRLADFLIHNKITDNIKGYNVLERISEWKGKTIEVISSEDGNLTIRRS